jgi:hypothetical protein
MYVNRKIILVETIPEMRGGRDKGNNGGVNSNMIYLIDFLFMYLLFFKFFFFYSYVHTMFGSFLSPSPTLCLTFPGPSLFPLTLSLLGRNYFVLISNFVEERV